MLRSSEFFFRVQARVMLRGSTGFLGFRQGYQEEEVMHFYVQGKVASS